MAANKGQDSPSTRGAGPKQDDATIMFWGISSDVGYPPIHRQQNQTFSFDPFENRGIWRPDEPFLQYRLRVVPCRTQVTDEFGWEVFIDFEFHSDRKSTRLNSSHHSISYAVFCLKKKKQPLNTKLMNYKKKNHETDEQTESTI